MKWHEPWMYRVRLKGDWIPRFAVAFAVGSLATTLLLVLFAINIKPPSAFSAFIGMAIFGGLAFMFLVNGRRTAGGRVRLCEEGIIRRRIYVGLSSQWVEEWNWQYSQIPQCAIIPGLAIDKSFNLLLFTDGSDIEVIGIPERVSLEQVGQLLASKGVMIRHDVSLPPEFSRPMSLPMPLIAGAIGFIMLLGGLGFYAMKTAGRRGNDVAVKNRVAENVDDRRQAADANAPRPQPDQTEIVPDSTPPEIPSPARPDVQIPGPEIARPEVQIPGAEIIPKNLPLAPPRAPAVPNNIPPPTATEPAPAEPAPAPLATREPNPATPAPNPLRPAPSQSASANKTELIGGTGGSAFEVVPPNHVPIVGFRFRLGNWGGKSAVAQLDPVNQREAPVRSGSLVIAREGFVVGGIQVDAEDLVQAVRVIFVKRADDGTLDKTNYYFSDWIGQTTGRPVKTVGKGNVPVIGVYGRRGLVIDAIGLVLAE